MNITAKAPADGAGAGAGAGAGGGSARHGLGAATLSTAHVVVTPGDIITAEAGYLRYAVISQAKRVYYPLCFVPGCWVGVWYVI